ncbi:MAG: UDP-glucose--hexose-1-phosphate uridylyltransferase [Flagellimonas sp.]
MESSMYSKPHRRFNILTGEWVLISPQRTQRPWQGKQEGQSKIVPASYDENCYLCPGNVRANGQHNPDYDDVYSFQNDFPALIEDIPDIDYQEGLLKSKSERGICKVICFSPNHGLTLPLMDVESIDRVVELWQKEYEHLGGKDGINHVQIFENKGAIMGCSNPHPHGQIWAQSSVPQEVIKKMERQKEYWGKKNGSLLQDYLTQELKLKSRIIYENQDFVALVPYWAIWPFETMILPKTHYQNIAQISTSERKNFAEMIKVVTIKYDNLFETSFPYSAGIHQAPTDGQAHDEWHFHMSFYPPLLRSATVKKFMVGYEMFANPQRDITAEYAANTLKNLSTEHYSTQKQ